MDIKELCFKLAKIDGTSGDETKASNEIKEILSEYMSTEIDTLGNVIGKIGDGKVNILLDAHIDRIGLIVREIDEKGFLLIDKVGGIDPRVLVGSEVVVCGKEQLTGVVCSTPPHLKSNKDDDSIDLKLLAIDIGMNKEEASKLVSIGDRIISIDNQYELLNNKISSSAFDDRCGIAAIIKAVDLIKDKIENTSITVQFSTQEEVGGSGAKTGAFSNEADYAIVVDVGFGSDPYCNKTETIDLGKGPSIGIAPTLDRKLTKELVEIAKEKGIPYQHDVMNGRTGTNADSINIAGKGVKTALISIPLRNMHTAVEVIDINDIEQTADLIAAFILKKESEIE